MRHQQRPAGKIQVADERHPPARRGQNRGTGRRGDVDSVMRLAWLAVQNPLAAIDAGDGPADRHVESGQEIACLIAGVQHAAGGAHRGGVGADAVKHLLRRGDMVTLQPVNPLDVIVALSDGKAGCAAVSGRPGHGQPYRRVAFAVKADDESSVITQRQGRAVEAQPLPGRGAAENDSALYGGSGHPVDAVDRRRHFGGHPPGGTRQGQKGDENRREQSWLDHGGTLPLRHGFGTPKGASPSRPNIHVHPVPALAGVNRLQPTNRHRLSDSISKVRLMSNVTHERVVIIGAGAAGLTAAIYTARANLSPVIIAGLQPGGQMTITTDVENYPGFADVIQGPWLMTEMQSQAENVGARVVYDIVTSLDASARPFRMMLDSGDEMTADSVIVATGASARWLGLESEQAFNGRGVSACATCDGFFYKERDVAVIGGGNTAVEEALYLANICNSVTLVHRRDSLRAEQIMQDRLLKHDKIRIEWNRTVSEVLGDDGGVSALRLASTTGEDDLEISVQGMFVAIGHDPSTAAFKDALTLDEEGYIIAETGGTRTSVEGVFAAGDCVDKIYRQAVTAAGMGCMAALDAERWLGEQD